MRCSRRPIWAAHAGKRPRPDSPDGASCLSGLTRSPNASIDQLGLSYPCSTAARRIRCESSPSAPCEPYLLPTPATTSSKTPTREAATSGETPSAAEARSVSGPRPCRHCGTGCRTHAPEAIRQINGPESGIPPSVIPVGWLGEHPLECLGPVLFHTESHGIREVSFEHLGRLLDPLVSI